MRLWRIMDAYLRRFLFSSVSVFQGASVNSAQGLSGEVFFDHSKHPEASRTIKQNTKNPILVGFSIVPLQLHLRAKRARVFPANLHQTSIVSS